MTERLNIKKYSWVKRGKQRREIILYIEGHETPTDIAKKSGYSLNNTSRVLNEFRKKDLVKCLNPKEKTGRLYVLKPTGKMIKDKLRKEKKS